MMPRRAPLSIETGSVKVIVAALHLDQFDYRPR